MRNHVSKQVSYYHSLACYVFASGFFELIGEKVPGEEELLDTLRKAVANSQRKRYHGDKGIEVLSPEGQSTCM